MLIDSHCHLDFPDFATELDARPELAVRNVVVTTILSIASLTVLITLLR